MNDPKITTKQAEAYQQIFDYFNDNLFDGELPEVILNFSRSGAKTVAFFKPNTWTPEGHEEERVHEISLTPRFLFQPQKDIFASLVHEQCHLWQHVHGRKIPRRGYHNREWAEKMLEIGLEPVSSTGGMTGQSVSETIVPGGRFEVAFEAIKKELKLPFLVLDENVTTKAKQTRSKYNCAPCNVVVYGKPGLNIICGVCNVQYNEIEP